MKDVTSTSFGLVIAYLLPGFAAFFAVSFWSPSIHDLFLKFLEAESNIGRFLLVVVCSLIAGLEVTVVRWLIFEKWLCRKKKVEPAKFAHLSIEAKLTAFRAATDEYYRYHQFWGGMAVAIPFVGFGTIWGIDTLLQKTCIASAFLGLEVVTVLATCAALKKYVDSVNYIMEGFDYAQRMAGEGAQKLEAEAESGVHASGAT